MERVLEHKLLIVLSIFFQINGVSLGSLDEIQGGALKSFFSSIRNTLDFDFEESSEGWFFSFSWINISN
jgi:hypothetical protein